MVDVQTKSSHSEDVLYKPPIPEAPSSPSSETESQFSESFYTSLLRKIPGFEGHSYRSTSSSDRDDTLPVRHSRPNQETPQLFYEDLSTSHPSSARPSSGRPQRINIDVLTAILPQLSTISRKRKHVLFLEFKIEAVHKKLKRTREYLNKEVDKGDKALENECSNVEDLREQWQNYSRRLRKHSRDLKREEDELEPLQYELTQAQYDMITLFDNLHASLTGGAKPGDSVASLEDHLLESFGGQLDPNPVVINGEQGHEKTSNGIQQATANRILSMVDTEDQVGSHAGNGLEYLKFLPVEHRSESLTLRSEGMEGQKDDENDENEPRSLASGNTPDLIHCGSRFSYTPMERLISEGAQAPQLLAEPALVTIRKSDLQRVLGYALQDLDRYLYFIRTLKKVNIGVAQRLSETTLPSVHTQQMISLWATTMSQNSALETSRTLLYGGEQIQDLALQILAQLPSVSLYSSVLLRLVQDVRQLQVPLDAKVNDAIVTLDRSEALFDNTGSLTVHAATSSDCL